MREPTFRDFLNDFLSPFKKDIELSGLKVIFEIAGEETGGLGRISTDWAVLKCVLFHLVYNAVKHSKKGSNITIKVDEELGFLVLQIKNLTDDVNATNWERVTQPLFAFQRVIGEHNETQGVGIGLSTANTLVNAMNGTLYFEIDTEFNTVNTIAKIQVQMQLPNLKLSENKNSTAEESPKVGVKRYMMS